MQVLNICILHAKYYIYIQHIFNNSILELYTCLTQLKQALKLEENICIKKKKEKFLKYNFIWEFISNNEDIACNYLSKTMYALPKRKTRVFKIAKHKNMIIVMIQNGY